MHFPDPKGSQKRGHDHQEWRWRVVEVPPPSRPAFFLPAGGWTQDFLSAMVSDGTPSSAGGWGEGGREGVQPDSLLGGSQQSFLAPKRFNDEGVGGVGGGSSL